MAWVAGDRLQGGKYTIERELGRGRFGITYLVKNQNGDRQVIKTLNDNLLNSLNQLERERLKTMFLREALKLQKCKHKYIVEVVDSFEEADCLCLVMEYVDEVSLADLRPPTLSEPDALRYIRQIGEALIVVHENELIHRDVHPGNILLRKREGQLEAVLIDFGLALDFDHILTTSRTKETSDGFTPPELYARGTITRAYSDIYSLAATLYKLLTGRTPVNAVKRKVDGEHLVSPKEWNPQISDRTNRAILTGMKLDPKERPQSMREWLDSLGLTGETSQPVATVSSNTNSNWDKKIQFWTVVIAAIGVFIALLAAIPSWIPIFKPSPSSSPPSLSPTPSSSKIP
ncbi:MAG: serine/threonine-protein kinase [Nostoc sp. DedQUE08]|uniref:serine/threonine protein kinase n=1 Tax=unclassified Nostoc TaxID=2593658 RepID=UPI002AD3009A|nr:MULTISPECIES: serine/threonine-protein kinase [unclassified Nostoc]MDZ8064864.1 serine/threonine-protein kinase [Nostoc sp. DedQUE08]MDZ8093981.1 serine/threonine-protein kinase [Nostoc sp. DedQUE05]